MDRDAIVAALTELGRRLDARGVVGEMYVVGGAAIALAFDARRTTKDVDAVFEPKLVVYDTAAGVGRDLDLPDGWLNDGVKGFLAGPDPFRTDVLEVPGLRIQTASPQMLLSLKAMAHRSGEDDDDVRLLAGTIGLDADGAVDLVVSVFGDQVTLAVELFVREALGPQGG